MSYKYQLRSVIIEAVQMTQERHFSNVDWPEWLHNAWNKNYSEPGRLFRLERDSSLQLILPAGQIVPLKVNDYIVKLGSCLIAMGPALFEACYESLPDDTRIDEIA